MVSGQWSVVVIACSAALVLVVGCKLIDFGGFHSKQLRLPCFERTDTFEPPTKHKQTGGGKKRVNPRRIRVGFVGI